MTPTVGYCVYKHKTPSGKVYIGVTCTSPKKRWNYGHGYKYNSHFWNAIVKYGWDNISHEILIDGLNRETAYRLERELIDAYDSTNPSKGYNITSGGFGGMHGIRDSDETKMRKSQSAIAAWKKRGRTQTSRERVRSPYSGRKRRKVLQFTLDGSFVREWDTLAAIEKDLGISWRNIQRCCNGKKKSCHGYAWSFKEGCA